MHVFIHNDSSFCVICFIAFHFLLVDFQESLAAALSKGSVVVEIVKCVTLGPPEAGKMQLKSGLVGKFNFDSTESTAMSSRAEVAMQRYVSGKSSWEPLTREMLLNFLHTTVDRQDFAESDSTADVETTQPMPSSHQAMSKTRAVSVSEAKKAVLLMKFSAIRKSVEQGLKKADSAVGKSLHKVRMIHMIDSGGQPAFFDVHPMIATSHAVYLLVYDLKNGLDDKPKITYRKRDFPTKDLSNDKRSNLDMIKDSLLILQNCKQKFVKMHRELHNWFCESFGLSTDLVPVVVVGTRKKKVAAGRQAEESRKLAEECSHLPIWREVLDCTETGMKLFTVDSKDRDCKGLQSVRDVVNEAECIYRLPLPISWVLCQLIFWSADEDLHILTYADLRELCLKEDLVTNNEQFLAMVRTFHLLGIFSFPYFDEEHTLGDQWKPDSHPVFTNPDVLYQQVTKILEVAFRHLEKTRMKLVVMDSLKRLQSSGRLNVGTLRHLDIPDKLGSYTGFHSYLLERLVHWGLAAKMASNVPTRSADEDLRVQPEYFVPSVFPANDQTSFNFHSGTPIPRLAFTFEDSLEGRRRFYHVPRGIFPHLVVNILSAGRIYEIPDNLDNFKCLFRDAVKITARSSCPGMEHSYSVLVTDDMDHISISIHPSHVEMKKSDCDCYRIISDFRSAMEDAYKRNYGTHHPVTLSCPCPCNRIGKEHLAAIVSPASNPMHYNQECLSVECPHWEQDCPKEIAAIFNQGMQRGRDFVLIPFFSVLSLLIVFSV